jgi:hypothetical protein
MTARKKSTIPQSYVGGMFYDGTTWKVVEVVAVAGRTARVTHHACTSYEEAIETRDELVAALSPWPGANAKTLEVTQ